MNELSSPYPSATAAVRKGAGQATMIEQSRAVAEVQAAVVVAQQRPRDKEACMREMREVCRIQTLAEKAFFRFNRGGGQVNGESIHLARELSRCWGNITCGLAELSRDDIRGQSEMMAFAWDLQTNDRQQTTFIVPHVRDTKGGNKPLIDMRDIYENNANMGARRLREMIFAVLPVWFREEAAEICRDTLVNGGGKPLIQRISDAVEAFQSIGVTRAQVETKLGRLVADFTAEDVATLGVVFKSIKRGEATIAEEFPREEAASSSEQKAPASRLDGIEAQIASAEPAAAQEAPESSASDKPEEPDEDAEKAAALVRQFQTAKNIRELTKMLKDNAEWGRRIEAERPELYKMVDDAFFQRENDFTPSGV